MKEAFEFYKSLSTINERINYYFNFKQKNQHGIFEGFGGIKL